MRVRAALATVALLLASPGLASAAEGKFRYSYYAESGDVVTSALEDPPSRECLDIPEVEGGVTGYVFRPRNHTAETATVFLGEGCVGDFYSLRPGGGASDRLLIRSVVFS